MKHIGFSVDMRVALLGLGIALCTLAIPNIAYAKKADLANKTAWGSVCVKDKKGKLLGCRLVQRILIQNGKNDKKKGLLLSVQLRRPKSGKPYIHLHLPLGLALPAGVAFSVMDGKTKKAKVAYKTVVQTCVAQGCIATLPLDQKLLKALKGGKTALVSFANISKKVLNVAVSLKGFTKAYAGLDKKLK